MYVLLHVHICRWRWMEQARASDLPPYARGLHTSYDDPVLVLVLLHCIGHGGAKHLERVQEPCLIMQALVCRTNLWPFAAIPHSCTFVVITKTEVCDN